MIGRGETNVRAIVHEIKKIPQNSPARQSTLWPPPTPQTHTHTLPALCSPLTHSL